MTAFQIIVLAWLGGITISVGILFRLFQVLTKDVERTETLGHQIKHLYVKSTFEEAGEAEQADAVANRGAFKPIKKFKTKGVKRG